MLHNCKLRDLINVTRGASLPGEYYSETGEYIRLTMGNFNYNGNGFKDNTSKTDIYYTGPIREEFILKKGDIITPLTEQAIGLLGTTAMIPQSGKYIQSQDVALITCKDKKLDHLFCYYLISSDIVKKRLSAAAQQTKIRHTSPDKIMDCTVWIPEMAVQQRIGKALHNIDQKIALNTRMNTELEAMAKQLYDYWFVQFDFPNENGKPYKSSGGKMVFNEELKREIPEGWDVQLIGSLLDKVQSTPRLVTDEYLMLSKNENVSIEYMYFYVKDINIGKGYARHYSFVKDYPIIIPSSNPARQFAKIAEELFIKIKQLKFENQNLTHLRDSLLPMLMNGQVTVE